MVKLVCYISSEPSTYVSRKESYKIHIIIYMWTLFLQLVLLSESILGSHSPNVCSAIEFIKLILLPTYLVGLFIIS